MQRRKQKNKKSFFNENESLYSKALQMAKKTPIENLFEKTKLPFSWLRKFRSGKIPNPSVNRIEIILRAFEK